MAREYFNDGAVKITDSLFHTDDGQTIQIRNIGSSEVTTFVPNRAKNAFKRGAVCFIFAPGILYYLFSLVSSMLGTVGVMGGWALTAYVVYRALKEPTVYQLTLHTSSGLQHGYRSLDVSKVKDVNAALNEAMSGNSVAA